MRIGNYSFMNAKHPFRIITLLFVVAIVAAGCSLIRRDNTWAERPLVSSAEAAPQASLVAGETVVRPEGIAPEVMLPDEVDPSEQGTSAATDEPPHPPAPEEPSLLIEVENMGFHLAADFQRRLLEGPEARSIQLVESRSTRQSFSIGTQERMSDWSNFLLALDDFPLELLEADIRTGELRLRYVPEQPKTVILRGVSRDQAVVMLGCLESDPAIRRAQLGEAQADHQSLILHTDLDLTRVGELLRSCSDVQLVIVREDVPNALLHVRSIDPAYPQSPGRQP